MKTYTITGPEARITCLEEVPEDLAREWLREHPLWFQGAGARLERSNLTRLKLEKGEVVVKREARSLARGLLRFLCCRSSRLKSGFEIGMGLLEGGVRAAKPLGLIERSGRGIVRESYLLLEVVKAEPLREFILSRLKSLEGEGARRSFKERLWGAIAEQVARLHDASVRQRDLKAPNLLVREEGEGGLTVVFVDLDGMGKLSRPPSRRVRIRDLGRLLVSLRETEMRDAGVSPEDWSFLVARYLEAWAGRPPGAEELRSFIDRTVKWAERKEARNRRRGRIIR